MASQPKFLCAILTLFAALTLPTSFPSAAQSEKSQTPSIGDQLVIRTYKLDSAKIERLDTTILNKPPGQRRPADILRALLEHERIEIPATSTNTTASPSPIAATISRPNQKSFYFNDRLGELTLRASRRDIPKFEKYLSQIAPTPPPIETDTLVRFHFTVTTNWIAATTSSPVPTNWFTYTIAPKSTVIHILEPDSSPIIPILPGDKSLYIRGDQNN